MDGGGSVPPGRPPGRQAQGARPEAITIKLRACWAESLARTSPIEEGKVTLLLELCGAPDGGAGASAREQPKGRGIRLKMTRHGFWPTCGTGLLRAKHTVPEGGHTSVRLMHMLASRPTAVPRTHFRLPDAPDVYRHCSVGW